jgi:hypothetical protein
MGISLNERSGNGQAAPVDSFVSRHLLVTCREACSLEVGCMVATQKSPYSAVSTLDERRWRPRAEAA